MYLRQILFLISGKWISFSEGGYRKQEIGHFCDERKWPDRPGASCGLTELQVIPDLGVVDGGVGSTGQFFESNRDFGRDHGSVHIEEVSYREPRTPEFSRSRSTLNDSDFAQAERIPGPTIFFNQPTVRLETEDKKVLSPPSPRAQDSRLEIS